MGHLEGNFTPVLYIWDAWFLKVNREAKRYILYVSVPVLTAFFNPLQSDTIPVDVVRYIFDVTIL